MRIGLTEYSLSFSVLLSPMTAKTPFKYGRKKLGLKELTAIGIGGMIGGGIFAVLGLSIQLSGTLAPLSFFVASIIAILTAYSYAKFSIYRPCMGGTIEYISLGIENEKVVGYLNTLLWFSYIVMLSLYSYAFGSYAAALLGFKEGTIYYVITKHIFLSLVLVVFTIVNILGAEVVGKVEDLLVYIKVLILSFFAIIGLLRSDPSMIFKGPIPSIPFVIAGGMIIFLAYEGFELISNAGADSEDKRSLYRAFFLSVAIVSVIYITIAYVSVTTLPVSEVVKYRDYALAVVAEPLLGKFGFVLIAIAALFSTASAINATIYGAGRIAYILFKYGEIRKPLTKKAWSEPVEGILITSAFALILANTYNLENISLMGSLGFLLVFLAVNYSAYKLYREIGANKVLEMIAVTLTAVSATILVVVALSTDFWGQLKAMLTLLLPPLILESMWRVLSSRRIKKPHEYSVYKTI